MIAITQGHERSISTEVFLKSIFHLSHDECSKILYFVNQNSLISNLEILKWPYQIKENLLLINNKKINCNFTKEKITPSTDSLVSAMNHLKTNKGVLFTLPTSKDQLFYKNQIVNGHTEYFRHAFSNNSIAMVFSGPIFKTVLVTDHIPISSVASSITKNIVIDKTQYALDYFKDTKKVIFSGINPHAGEKGLIGKKDFVISEAVEVLSKSQPDKTFMGPLAGDMLHREITPDSLLVYMAHDQGLAPFKMANGLYGSNISLGMPYLRFSPDHGTAFDLYGKNIASPAGCLYSLREALRAHG